MTNELTCIALAWSWFIFPALIICAMTLGGKLKDLAAKPTPLSQQYEAVLEFERGVFPVSVM